MKEKRGNYTVKHTYNDKDNAPKLEDIIHSKEFVETLHKLVIKYTDDKKEPPVK